MTTEYHVRIYNRAGTLNAVVVDFLQLAYRHERNAPGLLEIDISPNHPAVAALEIDGLVEVWRRPAGSAWYVDFAGLYRWRQEGLDENGRHWLKLRCPGLLHLVGRSVVAYERGVLGRSTFVAQPAETIVKALVTYNCTSSGNAADGRLRDVSLSGILVEADGARGDSLDFECSLQNVLTSIQRVMNVAGGDVVMSQAAAATYQFEWRAANQTDVVFAPNFGNMARPRLTRNWADERTVALAGGNGVFAAVQGVDYAAGYRDAEMYVSAPNYTTTDGLAAAGNAALEAQRVDELTFTVVQTPQARYGEHYAILDWITASFGGVTQALQIQEVGVEVAGDGSERIEVVCRG